VSYQVRLEAFEGPFDLLLQLIARRKLDVTDIDLGDITADFLASLDGLEELDLDTATRFLVVAATLIELKAARLLPKEDQDELEDLLGETRDLLYARLLEYRAFRDVAAGLRDRLDRHEHLVGREVPLEVRFQRLVPETPLPVGLEDLARLAAMATAPTPPEAVDLSHIRKSYISIRDAARTVLSDLAEAGRTVAFRSLVGERNRGDRVVFFLALLELYKLGHLDLAQPDHGAELAVTRLDGGHDLASITDDYEGDPEARAAAAAEGGPDATDDDHDDADDEPQAGEPRELAAGRDDPTGSA
jgi:segregation and condensation protein A